MDGQDFLDGRPPERELSRRDLLKLGLFGSAALLLPAERVARTALAEANRIPESRLGEVS